MKLSPLHKKSEMPNQTIHVLHNLSSDSSCGKWRGKTEGEGFLEYKLPSSSEDSKEESFANKNDTTDIRVIGEIPSLN